MGTGDEIIDARDLILVTGASGFVGRRVVDCLLSRGFKRVRCLVRSAGELGRLEEVIGYHRATGNVEIMRGDLLSAEDCKRATDGVAVVYHLAAGRGDFTAAFTNSVVPTRNLLLGTVGGRCFKRFVNISSFSVYSNRDKPQRRLLDESCPVETAPAERGDPYTFGKAKQDELVVDYGKQFQIPYVIVRPGWVYGPGNETVSNRVGIQVFGLFLHFGGSNRIPLTYVDNCADAIVLAGLKPGVEGEIFNVVDDDLPSSRSFLRLYKKNVRRLKSAYVPHCASYMLCWLWEGCSYLSAGRLPLRFNRKSWHAFWKSTCYTNSKLKERLGWQPPVPASEALSRYFESCRQRLKDA
jgi:nucleoside-diphosphate-sugar epimerase